MNFYHQTPGSVAYEERGHKEEGKRRNCYFMCLHKKFLHWKESGLSDPSSHSTWGLLGECQASTSPVSLTGDGCVSGQKEGSGLTEVTLSPYFLKRGPDQQEQCHSRTGCKYKFSSPPQTQGSRSSAASQLHLLSRASGTQESLSIPSLDFAHFWFKEESETRHPSCSLLPTGKASKRVLTQSCAKSQLEMGQSPSSTAWADLTRAQCVGEEKRLWVQQIKYASSH